MAENHNVAGLRVVKQVRDIIDDQIFAIKQRRIHAAAVDAVTADQAVHQPENKKGEQQRLHNLAYKDLGGGLHNKKLATPKTLSAKLWRRCCLPFSFSGWCTASSAVTGLMAAV